MYFLIGFCSIKASDIVSAEKLLFFSQFQIFDIERIFFSILLLLLPAHVLRTFVFFFTNARFFSNARLIVFIQFISPLGQKMKNSRPIEDRWTKLISKKVTRYAYVDISFLEFADIVTRGRITSFHKFLDIVTRARNKTVVLCICFA